MSCPVIENRQIVAIRVDATSYRQAADQIIVWAGRKESRYVCAAPVSTVMEAYDDQTLQRMINNADMVTPDGMPLVWSLKMLGVPLATRVYGPDLTLAVLEGAARHDIAVGLFGGSQEVAALFGRRMGERFPGLRIVFNYSPPFRPLTEEEDARVVGEIRRSGAQIILVGLGNPKQERWMALHKDSIPAVLLGVGAAFDFLAGTKPQAPRWLMQCGLEWVFRLMTEPRRLWKRYLKHNPRFVVLLVMQLLGFRRARKLA